MLRITFHLGKPLYDLQLCIADDLALEICVPKIMAKLFYFEFIFFPTK